MSVLIIDDSVAMRMLLKRILRSIGADGSAISEAEDGVQGLEAIKSSQPDLVLCDWNMPNMTGIELLQALNQEGLEMNFGFVTTEGTDEMRAKADEAGAKFLITKPFTPESVQQAIGQYL